MRASPGDRIVVKSQHDGEPDRDCQVLEVGRDGTEALFFPGPDATMHHGTQATD
jgi:Domain of unknown function (DUF1918)